MPTRSKSATLVMYHYVRNLENSAFPRLKGLSVKNFEKQLDFLQSHYTLISAEDLQKAVETGTSLPSNACHLTFDDGFLDHYETVFPRLLQRNIKASFYPPVQSTKTSAVLNTHKIHFILASASSDIIRDEIFEAVDQIRTRQALPDSVSLYEKFGKANRFDSADTAFIKTMLQTVLDDIVRLPLIDLLFRKWVTEDEASFSQKLYMKAADLREMIEEGMTVGGHGYTHKRLAMLTDKEQELEIDRTKEFLSELYGESPHGWIMCYPYGSYNTYTLQALRTRGCRLGLTTKVEVSDLGQPLELGRLDTNDVPF